MMRTQASKELRQAWVESGAAWWSQYYPTPVGWNPFTQLRGLKAAAVSPFEGAGLVGVRAVRELGYSAARQMRGIDSGALVQPAILVHRIDVSVGPRPDSERQQRGGLESFPSFAPATGAAKHPGLHVLMGAVDSKR
jgi:hypothetical protein